MQPLFCIGACSCVVLDTVLGDLLHCLWRVGLAATSPTRWEACLLWMTHDPVSPAWGHSVCSQLWANWGIASPSCCLRVNCSRTTGSPNALRMLSSNFCCAQPRNDCWRNLFSFTHSSVLCSISSDLVCSMLQTFNLSRNSFTNLSCSRFVKMKLDVFSVVCWIFLTECKCCHQALCCLPNVVQTHHCCICCSFLERCSQCQRALKQSAVQDSPLSLGESFKMCSKLYSNLGESFKTLP